MKRYSKLLVFLHWLLAPMLLVALFMGNDIAQLSNDLDLKVDRLQVHMAAGVIIGILFAIRFVVKQSSTPIEPLQSGDTGSLMAKVANVMHKAMYFIVFFTVVTGVGVAVQVDMQQIVALGETMPEDLSMLPPRKAHGVLTGLLALLIVLHFIAALYHQFVIKDGIFRRIWFASSSKR